MRTCPNCGTQYTDDTLQFCLQDGSRLTDSFSSGAPTVAFNEPETVVSRRGVSTSEMSGSHEQPRRPNTLRTVVITAVTVLLIFLFVILAGWMYIRNKRRAAVNLNNNQNVAINTRTPSPTKTPEASPTPTASPVVDQHRLEKEIKQRINAWTDAAESHDLESYMKNYADRVDYYNKAGASRAFVRGDKEKAFSKFSDLQVNLSNIKITPDPSGEKATMVFDKEWDFEGGGEYSSGKVQQQMILKKIGGQWLIAAEKDLKVYYKE